MNGMHGIIFSYEKRNDLRELGEIRSASSIPFGGRYRAVDFALSNLVNAGVTDVGVVLHGHYQSLLDHLGTGKDWDLSRKRGGLKILPPFAYKQHWGEAAVFRGKMEALAGVRSYLEEIRRDYVVLMDGDLVVNLPLSDIYDQHIKSGADITVVCGNDSFETENGTYFELDGTGRVTDVLYHLHRPRGYRGLEVYILSTRLLLDLVDECATRDQYSLRRDVLQARKDSLKLQGYIWGGFAAQIRSVQEYYDRSMQLLDPAIRAELFCAERPIRAKATDKSSAYIGPDGYCENSLIADGCNIEGVVENSILFPGVLNGIDVKRYDPAADPHIAVNYSAADMAGKQADKAELQKLMGLRQEPYVPIVGIVSRLVSHKGLDLVCEVLHDMMELPLQMVILGKGDRKYEEFFQWAAQQYSGRMAVRLDYNEELSMAIYAGADLFLMPSKSEPCGLSQMIAMRYGTVPIVRETGGLKDTVTPYEAWRDSGNGFTFANYASSDMLYVIREAVYLYKDYPDAFARLRARAMACDFSWARSAGEYLHIYSAVTGQPWPPAGEPAPANEAAPTEEPVPAEEPAPAADPPAAEEAAPEEAAPAEAPAEVPAEAAAPAQAPAREPAPAEAPADAPEKKPAAGKRTAARKTAAKKPAAKKTAAKTGRKTPAKKQTTPKKGTAGKEDPAE